MQVVHLRSALSHGNGIHQKNLRLVPQPELLAVISSELQCTPGNDACGQPFKLASNI